MGDMCTIRKILIQMVQRHKYGNCNWSYITCCKLAKKLKYKLRKIEQSNEHDASDAKKIR